MRDDRYDRDDREERRQNPMKWILLITGVLLVYAWVDDKWGEDGRSASHAATGQHENWGRFEDWGRYDDAPQQDIRQLTGFESIKIRGNVRLDVRVGDTASVSLEGRPEATKAVRAYVKDNTLIIAQRSKRWSWNKDRRVTAHVTIPSLEKLDVAGTSSIDITGMQTGNASIVLSGTSRLHAEGQIDSLQLIINGTGRVDLASLSTDEALVVVNGAGVATMDVHKTLVATVNGAGRIRYSGAPEQVTSNVHGAGSVRQI
jgi:hypothetical protein